ncbi:MAG TPA: class I SAM-dependent methyltransferase [Acidimicrobiia bacterium]|jgi:SAM-dependent methyltransferase
MSAPVNLWSESSWAQRYLRERDDIPHRMEGFAVLMELLPAAPRRVLDLGTGDGFTLGLVRSAFPHVQGVGVDFSAEMLALARDRFAGDPDVQILEHDLDDPLPDLGRFDLVVSSFAIHHCVDERKRALYGEVFRALEPGGRFLNLEHVESATPQLHVDFLAAIGKTPAEDDPSNKLVAVHTQLAWLREIGFVQVDCHWKWRELALLAGVKPG